MANIITHLTCFIVGGLLGALVMALLVAASNTDKVMAMTNNKHWWHKP